MNSYGFSEQQLSQLRSLYQARKRLHRSGLTGNQSAIDRNRRSLVKVHQQCQDLHINEDTIIRVYHAAVKDIPFDEISLSHGF